MPGFDVQQSTLIRRRLFVCGGVFFLLLGAVLVRAVHLQLTEGPKLSVRAANQYKRELELQPRRGLIVDRSGKPLATSVPADSVFVDAKAIREAREKGVAVNASAIAHALHIEPELVRKKINKSGSFQWLKRRISPEESRALKALGLDKAGIQTVGEFRRFYPGKRLASHVVGTVSIDNDGLEGVEKAEDELLSGKSHAVRSVRDVKGTLLWDDDGKGNSLAGSGARVELTIDSAIQQATEAALEQQVEISKPVGAMVVVMDPKTGAVLALASSPSFNPNAPGDLESRRNRPVVDSYEPGSVMKCFLFGAALSERLVKPETMIDVTGGELHIGKKTIHDSHRPEHNYESVREVLAKSSNVGSARIGLMLGPERLLKWFKAFGFGERTGVGLSGEARGVLQKPERMGEIATATTSFGQGMTASALQVTAALSAIANDGKLMKPYLVQRVVQADGSVLVERHPEQVRQVLTPDVAHVLTRIMVGVTEKGGTGLKAAIPGIEVAGKTGTAQKADPITHAYGGKRFSSFMGFAPANDPKIAVYVAFDEPQGEKYGGDVAAPVFKSVATAALLQLGVALSTTIPPPPVVAEKKGVKKTAAPKVETAESDEAFDELFTMSGDESLADTSHLTVVPDVKGCSARSSLRLLHDRALEVDVEGFGRVMTQHPEAGRQVPAGTHVRVTLGAG